MKGIPKNRLEAFSDGVFAIIITIMVLELKVPHTDSLNDLIKLAPVFLSYLLSFIYVAIYWNNHHHLFHIVKHVNGSTMWANVHLLFWLSLVPFATAWSGENSFSTLPVALYGLILLLAAISYFILTRVLLASHGSESEIAKALGADLKGKLSVGLYALAIPLSFLSSALSMGIYVLVAIVWFVPDSRVENVL